MSLNKLEIGSEFHNTPMDFKENLNWFPKSCFLHSGRSPVVLLKDMFKGRVIYCPDFFCHDVIKYWNDHGIKTIPYRVYYEDGRIHVDYSTLPKNGVVLGVNFFGYYNQAKWSEYKRTNDIILIEDHSHAPISFYALNSIADFAFSSLRKTLPVPDGCIFWSPIGKSLPKIAANRFDSEKKIEAMRLKSIYLNEDCTSKKLFLDLYRQGEADLSSSDPKLISEYSRKLIVDGYPLFFIEKRRDNYDLFISSLNENVYSYFDILKICDFEVPLGVVLKLNKVEQRNLLREYLIGEGVFCPVHWPLCESITRYTESKDLSETLITIPLDQRYSSVDVMKVASLINRYFIL